jgi:hypothetical protein
MLVLSEPITDVRWKLDFKMFQGDDKQKARSITAKSIMC